MSGKKVSEKGWCASCGIQAPSGALYCPRCGEPIHPSYLYSESLSSEDAIAEEKEETREKPSIKLEPVNVFQGVPFPPLYEGVIQGLVTGELKTGVLLHGILYYFGMKLEESFGEVSNEVLVCSEEASYLRMGDKVTLHGKIIKEVLKKGGRLIYLILANHIYNETLNIVDEKLIASRQVIYNGTIRGSVAEESKLAIGKGGYGEIGKWVYGDFLTNVDENIGIKGVPDEILVQTKRGYFRKGDEVFLQGKILKIDIKKMDRPMYIIEADHYYNESLQIGDETWWGKKQVLYEGMFHGSVTGESTSGVDYYGRYEFFVVKLEENLGIAGIPNELLVQTSNLSYSGIGHFGIGDKVTLQGSVVKEDLRVWNKPMYTIIADHYYNETLLIGNEKPEGKKRVLYAGTFQGSVTRESTVGVDWRPVGTFFAVKLDENIRLSGIPDEILVQTGSGYFRKGDKVILNGKILRIDLRLWGRPMYLIMADNYYNESLQIGD